MNYLWLWLKKYYHILALVLIFTIVYHRWLFETSILTHGDWHYFLPESLRESRLFYFSTWLSDFGLGREVIDVGQAPTYALYGVLNYFFGFNFEVASRIVHLWPIVVLTPLAGYLLSAKMSQKKMLLIAGTLIYSANTYFLILQTGHVTLMAAFNFALFSFLAYVHGLEKKSWVWLLSSGVFLSVASVYEPRVFYIGAGLLALYGGYTLLTISLPKKNYQKILSILQLGLPLLVSVPLNIFWILPIYFSGLLSSNEFFDRVLFGNEFMNIVHALTMFHPYWTGSAYIPFVVQPVPIHLWLLPILAMIGLFLKRTDRLVLFFGFLSIIGIFLTKQSGAPFEHVYNWLYQTIPGFNAFREATKFYFLTAVGYTALVVAALDYAATWSNEKKNLRWKNNVFILTIIVIAAQLLNFKPLLTGEIGTLFTQRQIPAEYLLFRDQVVKDSSYFKVLWVPTYSRWSIFTQNHPKLSLVELLAGNWNQYVSFNRKGEAFPTQKHILQLFINPITPYLLDSSSIKYVAVPPVDSVNDDNFYQYYGNRESFVEMLKRLPYLKQLSSNQSELLIFENEGYKPRIYLSDLPEDILKETSYTNVEYEQISPAEYNIKIENLKTPIYVHFTEKYHPLWKVKAGDFNWKQGLNKTIFLDDKFHFKNQAQLNDFLLDPEYLKTILHTNEYTVNSDDSINFSATIYFQPQSSLYLGMIISFGTLVMVGVIILIHNMRHVVFKVRS